MCRQLEIPGGVDMKALISEFIKLWAGRKGVGVAIDESLLAEQVKVAESIWKELEQGGRLILLKAPTASGKTEVFTSLYFYQYLTDTFINARLFIIEPVHALLRQMRERVEAYANKFGVLVGEDHGETVKPAYLYSAPVTLTTVDSYVYGYLAKRVAKKVEDGGESGRYTMPVGLMTHALNVLDEAHLVQDEVFLGPRVLAKVVCPIVKAGGHFIVATATMPTAMHELLISECGGGSVYKLPPKKRDVSVEARNKTLEADDVSCSGRLLVVANTVGRARELYRDIKNKCKRAFLIHSLLTRGERDRVLVDVAEANRRGDDFVLVGTQAVEVGIDFNFDVLHTEMAPLDSLIQRLGRVGRGGKKAEAYVYLEVETHLPYDKDILERSKGYVAELGVAINDVDKTTELLDEVYHKEKVEEMAERGAELYLETVEYISNLHLFAPPPPGEVWLRPSIYVDIYIFRDAPPQDRDQWGQYMVRLSTSITADYDRLQKLRDAANAAGCETMRVDIYNGDDLSKACGQGCIMIPAAREVVRCPSLEALYDETGLKLEQQPQQQAKKKALKRRRR